MSDTNTINKKQISINMISNIISYSSNIIISFCITPFLINTLGKDVYSFYPLANNIVSYLSILTGSLNTMASRFFTIEIVKGDEDEANRYYSSVLASNVFLSCLILIPMILIIVFIDKILQVPVNSIAAIRMLFALVFSAALMNIIGSIYGIATFARNRIDLRSIREIVTAIIRLGLYVLFYKFLPVSIIYMGIVTVIVAGVSLLIQVGYTRKLLPGFYFRKKNVSLTHAKKLFSSTSWNLLFTFGNVLLSGLTLILLNILFGAESSGAIAIVQTVPAFINGVISMLVGVFFPVITYRIAENDIKGAVEQITYSQRIIAILGCAVISVFSGMASDFFSLWVPDENAKELSKLSLITIVPHLVISCTWILTNLNIAMNKVKKPALFTVFIGILNVLLSLFAVNVLKASYLCVPIISSILQIIWAGIFLPIYSAKEMNVPFFTFYPPLLKALLTSFVCYFFTIAIKSLFIINHWYSFAIIGGSIGIISLLFFALIELGSKQVFYYCNIGIDKVVKSLKKIKK